MKSENLLFGTACLFLALSAFCSAQSSPPLWNPTTSYQKGDEVTYFGNIFYCLVNETSTHPNPHSPSWDLYFVTSGTFLIPVGPNNPFKSLASAWSYIAYTRVANNASILIKLDSNYNETFSNSFSLDHPFGSRISIVGTNAGQAANFTTANPGFTLDGGHTLGDLEGLKITETGSVSAGAAAIQVSQNAVLTHLKNVSIASFNVGLLAQTGGLIDNVTGMTFAQFRNGVAHALSNGVISFSSLTIDGRNSSTVPLYGVLADGGTISCPGSTVGYCNNNYVANHSGTINAAGATTTSLQTNGYGACFYAGDHSYINANTSTTSGGSFGYYAIYSSTISAQGSGASGYTSQGYQVQSGSTINAAGTTGGSRMANGATDGSYIFTS